ncbi:uncharacterized protein LOC126889901 [Diabrotica virgifera virgifera]|uniref:Uncharacterized protein LOC114344344 n=1 Tax=Diabrotica virgifera virgifera TaxID=50390 RepID=A0A6P7H4Q7_DIAVI|nr:uncharacterized protein LOC126889901 [Diabrotica virgifera virgifera]
MSKPKGSVSSVSKAGQLSVSGISRTSRIGARAPAPPPKVGLEKPPKGLEWTLPPFSVCPRPKTGIDWDELKKRMIRRQAPEGEDIKGIRLILKELQGKNIPVQDFVNLISAYTSDNGDQLRQNLSNEITLFQKLCRNVYQTMTQDISDVLINEQLLTVQFYQERHDIYIEKMMKAINEIYDMAPTFDFEKYYNKKEEYLNSILPVPHPSSAFDKDTELMMRRQQLYHRLQWLRNEGERMSDENNCLEQRLKKLKEQQEYEQKQATEAAETAETKAAVLAKEESKMRDTLQKLNIDIEKTIIESEAHTVKAYNEANMQPLHPEEHGKTKRHKKKRQDWLSHVAQEIDTENVRQMIAVEREDIPLEPCLRKVKMDSSGMETQFNITPREKRSRISFNPEFNSTQLPPPPQDVIQDTKIDRSHVTVQKQRFRDRPNFCSEDTWNR